MPPGGCWATPCVPVAASSTNPLAARRMSTSGVTGATTAVGKLHARSAPNRRILREDGMSPLRHMVAATPGAFKCALDRGTVQICQDFRQGFIGRGCERYATGEIYVGDYMAGERHGRGTFRHANGQTLVSRWKDNRPVGDGIQWSADHKKAAKLKNGVPVGSCTLKEAGALSARLGMPVPGSWLKE